MISSYGYTSMTPSSPLRVITIKYPSWGWQVLLCILAILALVTIANAAEVVQTNQDVARATLDNGLRVVVIRNNLAPVATTSLNYLVGSDEAPEGFPGMAHAQEHMMFRGSTDLSADQLAGITAGMGGDFDAQTQQTVTQYYFTVPIRDLSIALKIEATRMRSVLDSDALWRQERGAIEQEVAQDFSNPTYVFYSRLLRHMFSGTPYDHDALGTRPSFDRTTGRMLHNFYDSWYAPNNAILIITGAVDPESILKEVKALFGGIPRKPIPKRPDIKLQPVRPVTLHQATDLPYGMVTLSMRLPGFDSPDYAAAEVLGDVLNSKRAALAELVARGEALDAEFEQETLPKAGIGTVTLVFPAGGDPSPVLTKMKRVLSEYAGKGVSPDLVAAAKRRELAEVEFQKNSVNGLASVWAQALAVEGRNSPQDDIEAIEQVSVEDVNRVARTYLDLKHAVVGVLTPSSSQGPASSKGFGGTESFPSKPVTAAQLPKWAADELTQLSVPPSTLKPVVSDLPNGIKLIVQPETVSDSISLYGHVKSNPGMEAAKGTEGVSEVLDYLFSYGTTHFDRLAFQKALDEIGADAEAGAKFHVQALSGKFEHAVELLADNELNPALPQKAFDIVQRQEVESLQGLLQSPDYRTQRALVHALFPETDPALRQATPETVKSLDLSAVRQYYQHVFRPDLTTIVVIGNVTPERARAVVEKYFGGWKAEGAKPDTLFPTVPPNKASSVHIQDSSQVQEQVSLAQSLGMNRFNPDYYALEMGNQVLSGGFYASRLYRDLREEAGLVYYVASSPEVGETRGIFRVEYACDPPNVAKARALVLRDIAAMQTDLISDQELHQAKAILLRQIPLSEKSEYGIAQHFLSWAEIGLPLDESTQAARHYFKMTADEIQAAYKKWLRPAEMVEITEGPSISAPTASGAAGK